MPSKTCGPLSNLSGTIRFRLQRLMADFPKRRIILLGQLLGGLAFFLDTRHRRIASRNLRFTYPEWNPLRIQEITKRVFQNLAVTTLEVIQMASFSKEDVLNRVRVHGLENLLSAVNHPKGSIMISAHLGNWEMSLLAASCFVGKPLVAVARPLESSTLNRWILRVRTRFGNIILDKKGALPKMVRMLRQGKSLGILIDQGENPTDGVDVKFFGHSATATPVAALLARRYGSPVFPGYCIRDRHGCLTLIVDPPLRLQKTADRQADIRVNTQIMTLATEKAIRAYPEQWLWLHKRWKQYHPALYPEDLARQRRRRARKRARGKKIQKGA